MSVLVKTSDIQEFILMKKYLAHTNISQLAGLDTEIKNALTFCEPTDINTASKRPLDPIDLDVTEIAKTQEAQIIDRINKSNATTIVCPSNLDYSSVENKILLLSPYPRYTFVLVAYELGLTHKYQFIDATITYKEYLTSSGIVIGLNCSIGINVNIGPNVVIYPNTIIGNNVTIQANSVIGAPGFGMWRTIKGNIIEFPQVGRTIIEDDVTIGANSSIDCGALGDTIIGEGTKIDNLVHVGHNSKIGKYCVIVSHVMLGGSAQVGDYSWIAPGSMLLNQVEVGKNCVIGMHSVVLSNLPDNSIIFNPVKKVIV